MFERGRAAQAAGDRPAALALFREALALRPDDLSARTAAADTLRDLGRADEAEAAYRALLEQRPDHLPALIALGHLAGSRADSTAAAAWFRRAVQADPESQAAHLTLAAALRDCGDFEGAVAAATAVLDRDPGSVEAWASIGQTERRAGHRTAARDAFLQASALAPDSARLLAELAVEERHLGHPEVSARLLDRALALDPGSVEALHQLGEHHRISGGLEAALDCLRRAAAAPGATTWTFVATCDTLARLGRFDAALHALDEGRERLGPLPDFAAKRAELLRRAGYWPRALALATEAARIAPHHFGLWFERAQLEAIRGGSGAFAAILREAPARTTHEAGRALHLQGLCAAEEWRLEEAMALYARAIALNPGDAWLRVCMTQAQLLTLDLDGARDQLRAVAGIDLAAARLQGRSSNLSQIHMLGQLLDEYLLDREALDALRALLPLPPEGRIAPLLALVRRHPDYTPAAIALVAALRQAGHLAISTPGEGDPGGLPNRIAQYWDSDEVPPDLGRTMGSWAALYPAYSLRRFGDRDAQEFLERSCRDRGALAAYRRCRQPAQKADIFRLAWLHARGGIYVDADDLLVGEIGELGLGGASFLCHQEDVGTLGNNLVGAAPGHPVIARALSLAVEAVNRDDNDLLWLSTGPGLLTRAFAGHLADLGADRLGDALDGVRVLGLGELRRVVSIHCLVGYKSTPRHWSQTAFGRRTAAIARVSGSAAAA